MPQMESAVNLRRQYGDVDLLISCGDMPSVYLEFITSVLNVPLFYVRGNHDEGYAERGNEHFKLFDLTIVFLADEIATRRRS